MRKAVILARGLGTRMRRPDSGATLTAEQATVADQGLKAMIPVGRPFLDFVLNGLADAGFSQVCLVVAPQHDAIRDYYSQIAPRRINLHYAVQTEAIGTANAVLAAERFAGDNQFIVMNSDNYYPSEALNQLQELGCPGTVLFEEDALVRNSNIPPERVNTFAYGVVDGAGYLTDLIEKPDDAAAAKLRGGPVSMNIWRFSPAIFDVCRRVPLSPRGEYELPMAVHQAIQEGMKLMVARSRAGVLDMSNRGDIVTVKARLKDVQVEL